MLDNCTATPIAMAAARPLIINIFLLTLFFPFGASRGLQVIQIPSDNNKTKPTMLTINSDV